MNDKQYQELKNFDCRIEKTIATLTNTVNGIKNSLNNLHYQKSLIIKNNGVGITPLNFDTLDFLGGTAFSEGHTVKVTFPNGSGGSVLDYSITNIKLAKSPSLTLKGNKFVTESEVQDLTVSEIKTLLSYNKGDIGLGLVDNTSDLNKPLSNADIAALATKAPLNSPTFIGTPTAPTPLEGDNSTKLATTAFVFTAIEDLVSGSVPDATVSVKGKLKLAGDLGGTADLPTVPELANKQATLVSGTNIKTINSTSLLGSGNIAVQATLVSGTNIKTINGTSLLGSGDITILGGSGEVNTASNIGTGSGIYKQKTGVDLELKTLVQGTGITITSNTNDLTIASTITQYTDGLAQSAVVIDSIADSDTTHAPSRNAVFDALATKQPLDSDLTAIAALTGTSGFLKTNGSGTWSVDTSTFLTGNESITLSGEASGSGTTGISVTLANSAVIAKVLTGFTSTTGTILATDSILQAIQKLDGNLASATAGGVSSVTGTLNRITSTGGSTPTIDISSAYVGQTSITTLGTVTTGTYQATPIVDAYIANSSNWNTAYTNRITSLTTTGNSGASTLALNVLNIPNYTLTGLGGQPQLSGTGFVKISGTTISYDNSTYLTGNQSISLTGEATGSGTTSLSVTLSNSAVIGKVLTGFTSSTGTILATDSILQAIQKLDGNLAAATAGGVSSVSGTTNRVTSTGGSNPIIDISASYVGQSSINTLGTITTGVWNGTAIGDTYISSASTWNGKQAAYTNLTSIGTLANGAGVLTNNGSGTFSYTTITSNATHTGDATGSVGLTVVGINGTNLAGLATGILKNTTSTGVPSIAIAADFPTLNQNTTGSAATLTTGRTIAITGDLTYISPSFNGSSNVTAIGTLATVNSNVGTFGSATQVAQVILNAKGLVTGATNITITPAASSITGGAALTKVDDTNITLTLGGTPSTALLQATSITVGWTGTLADSRITSASNWNSKQAGIQFKDEGVNLGAANTVTEINFTGNGISASRVGNIITVDVGATSGVTNLTYTSSASNGIVVSDTGIDATLPAATTLIAGLMIPAQFDKLANITITQAVDLDALESDVADLTTLSGVASNSTTLGTFTGATIPDNSTVKAALQSLETALEARQELKIRTVTSNPTISATTDGTIVMKSSATVAALPSVVHGVILRIKNKTGGNISVTGHLDETASSSYTLPNLETLTVHGEGTLGTWIII
mgnify:CR=1 FL=1